MVELEKFNKLDRWLAARLATLAYREDGIPGFAYKSATECQRIENDFREWEMNVSKKLSELIEEEHNETGRRYSLIRERYPKDDRRLLIAAAKNIVDSNSIKEHLRRIARRP